MLSRSGGLRRSARQARATPMPDVVVDIGNSRIKFCRCDAQGMRLPVHAMSVDDIDGWNRLAAEWGLKNGVVWAVGTSNPDRRDQFIEWAAVRGDSTRVIET